MPEIDYATRVAIVCDVITRARAVGAYQVYDWLEHHLKYLETMNNDRVSTGTDAPSSSSS